MNHALCSVLAGALVLAAAPRTPQAQTAGPGFGSSRSGYVDAGARLYYEECGAGTGVILLHDGLLHAITWDAVWPSLCAKYHVVRYDRRGYGRSEAAKAPFSPEDDLAAVMRHTALGRAVIVGNSSGAGLALDFALAHPDMVDALCLIGPVVHGMSTSQFFTERGNRNNAPLDHDDVRGAAKNWSEDPFLIAGKNERARQKLYDALVQSPQNLKTGGQLEVRSAPPAAMRLSEIQTPTLVIVGAADIADVHAYSGAIEAALPVVVREVWADTGHLLQLEHPDELVARLSRFVALAERPEVTVASALLDRYVGRYKLGNGSIVVSRTGSRLSLAVAGLSDRRLFAASSSTFFVRTTGTEVEFQEGSAGQVARMVVHNSDGTVVVCERV